MDFFHKLLGGQPHRPIWAAHISPDEYQIFRRDLERELKVNRISLPIDWVEGYIKREDGSVANLHHLILTYAKLSADLRKKELARFAASLASEKDTTEMSSLDLRDALRVRLYTADFHVQTLVHRNVCEAFQSVVTINRPTMVTSLSVATATKMGMSEKQAFEAALNNTYSNEHVEISREDVTKGFKMTLVQGESHFSASHALHLGKYVKAEEPHWLIIPNRNLFAFAPVGDTETRAQLEGILKLAMQQFLDSGCGVTPHLLLWNVGTFDVMSSEKKGHIQIADWKIKPFVSLGL